MLTAPTSTAHPVHPVPNRQRGNPIPTTGHQGTIHLKPTDKTPVMYHEQLAYRRVSPRLIPLRQITNAIGFACFFLVTFFPLVILRLAIPEFFRHGVAYLVFIVPVGILVWGIVMDCVIPRRVRVLGSLERDSDQVLRRGMLFRDQVEVPYDRVPYVDILQGPLQRVFGVTYIVITTAGGGTVSNFEGLPMLEAERLRDDLTHRG